MQQEAVRVVCFNLVQFVKDDLFVLYFIYWFSFSLQGLGMYHSLRLPSSNCNSNLCTALNAYIFFLTRFQNDSMVYKVAFFDWQTWKFKSNKNKEKQK